MEQYYSLLLFLFFLTFSLQIHVRESRFFFSKTSRFEASPETSIAEEPSSVLPLQSHNGYGLYGRDPVQFPSTATPTNYEYNNNNNAAYRKHSSTSGPSSFTNVEFSSQNHGNKERNANSIPSSFNNAEFSTANYTEFPTETYEIEYSSTNNNPSANKEFNRGSYGTKVPNYPYYDKQYGMSDTRFLENGKYFYGVNTERNSRQYEQMKGNSERYGSYGNGGNRNEYEYKNEVEGYQNSQEKQEIQEDHVP